jgi:hypothetical protein
MLKNNFMKNNLALHFMKSLLLFGIAFVLLVTTAPVGFVYTLVRQIFLLKFRWLAIYFIEVAIALDAAGNVLMQHLLNDMLLVKKESTYYFGNKKETISSVLGKNELTNTLSVLGKALNSFLNAIDNGHALNSIQYDVKRWREDN